MKKGDKKGSYFFQFLTDKEKIEFKANFIKLRKLSTFEEWMNSIFLSFEKFIVYAFLWLETNEGHKYWEKISLREIQEPQTQAS